MKIVELALQALHSSGYRQLQNLQVYCENGRVTLQGRVPTDYLKQLANECIRSAPGVREVDNDIKVQCGDKLLWFR